MIENAVGTIVLTAQTFNPSIFTETWMVENGVLKADSLVGARICTPQFARFEMKDIQVNVLQERMDIFFRMKGVPSAFDRPRQIAEQTVRLLPHTPYQALGLNFDYYVAQPKGQDFSTYNRDLLGNGPSPLLQEFSASDARFGRYLSKDYEGCRLRLDIRPVRAGPEAKEMIQFSFNFNFSVANIPQPERIKLLPELMARMDSIRKYAERLLEIGSGQKTEEGHG